MYVCCVLTSRDKLSVIVELLHIFMIIFLFCEFLYLLYYLFKFLDFFCAFLLLLFPSTRFVVFIFLFLFFCFPATSYSRTLRFFACMWVCVSRWTCVGVILLGIIFFICLLFFFNFHLNVCFSTDELVFFSNQNGMALNITREKFIPLVNKKQTVFDKIKYFTSLCDSIPQKKRISLNWSLFDVELTYLLLLSIENLTNW